MSRDDQPDLDTALADAVRRAYVRPVDEVTAGRHLSAIAAAAASAGDEPVARRPRRRRRAWRPVLAAGVAALLLPVGLATAGVSLPAAVERPYRSVGITLPHQARDAAPAPPPAPVTPRPPAAPPASSEPPRTTERPAGRARAGDRRRRQRQRGPNATDPSSRQGSPLEPASGGAADKPRPAPRRPARPEPRPSSSSKPSGNAKQDGSKKRATPPPPAPRANSGRQERPPNPPKPPPEAPALRPTPERGGGSQQDGPGRGERAR